MKPKTNIKEVVKNLKSSGFEVRIEHQRRAMLNPVCTEPPAYGSVLELKARAGDQWCTSMLDNQWGKTIVTIHGVNEAAWSGVASTCKGDQFNKKRGLIIAMGRAIKSMNDTHPSYNYSSPQ